jgi:hypothetical protein
VSGKLVGMVFEHFEGDASEVLLAVKLADNAHDDGRHIFPSVATLAEQTRRSERTVQYQLKRLVASSWLLLVREAVGGGRGGGYGRPREYRIHPDWIRAHDARTPEAERPAWPPALQAAKLSTEEMGADSAPSKNGKWVQPSVEMGAIAVAEMGAIAVAPEPSLTVKEPIPPVSPVGDARAFEQLLEIWPAGRRQRVEEARVQFDQVVAQGRATTLELLDAARAQSTDDVWRRDGGRFVPLLLTWLKKSRWKDGRSADAPPDWSASRQGVEARAVGCGMERWDRAAFNAGRGESWPAYRARVVARAAEVVAA